VITLFKEPRMVMKRVIAIVLVTLAIPGVSIPQSTSDTTSPKQVIERFIEMEVQGIRLTAEGRRNTEAFFVHPDQIGAYPKIFVIGENFTTWDPVFDTAHLKARVDVEIVPKGDIDLKVRFMPIRQAFQKNNAVFHLRYEDGQLGSEGPQAPKGPRWRIDQPNDVIMLSLSAAILYASRVAESANDPVIRKNAVETLASLKKLR
jgi:hypothetical protein